MHKISKMKEPRGRDRFLNKQEIKNLMHACLQSKSAYLYPVVLLALITGMRQGEILSLKWNDIDFEKNTIYVRETKNGEARIARMAFKVKKTLLALLEKRSTRTQLIFAPKKKL
jgi:integrase